MGIRRTEELKLSGNGNDGKPLDGGSPGLWRWTPACGGRICSSPPNSTRATWVGPCKLMPPVLRAPGLSAQRLKLKHINRFQGLLTILICGRGPIPG